MIHRSASSQPYLARRAIPRARRTFITLSGLGVFLAATIGLAPAAWATFPPPEPPPAPGTATDPTVVAHFPPWAIVALVAGTVVLSVTTTLVTLSLEHMRRARRTPAAATEPQAGVQSPSATAGPEAGQGEILASHQHLADYDMYRPGSR
jgi:hypothetical protein